MMVQFPKNRANCSLDQFTYKALQICEKVYPEYTHKILSCITTTELKNEEFERSLERLRNSKINKTGTNETFMGMISAIYDRLQIEEVNDYQEALLPIYSAAQLDSRSTNEVLTNCKGLANQFKNQDYSQKMISLVDSIEDKLEEIKTLKGGKIELALSELPLLSTMAMPREKYVYKEKSIRNCVRNYNLGPDIYVVYSGRKLKLELEFTTISTKTCKFTIEKSSQSSYEHFLLNHYSKLLNSKLLRDPETVYRDVKFLVDDIIFLDEDFCFKKKFISEEYLVDALDSEMKRKGYSMDHPIKLLAEKKNLSEINEEIGEIIDRKFLKNTILRNLNSEFDLFYWRKRYGHFLATNSFKSMIFANDTEFEQVRLSYDQARIVDDSVAFKIDKIKKTKRGQVLKIPLRLTKNNQYLLKDYMIEGVIVPVIMSMGKALTKSNQDFDISVILGTLTRDYLTVKNEDKIESFVSQSWTNYFEKVLMMCKDYYEPETMDKKSKSKNREVKCLKDYIDLVTSEDYYGDLELKHRVWS